MNYHIEHAKYKYGCITAVGWLAGDTADVHTSVWAEDAKGIRISCETRRMEREDVREALFPQETQCLFGFRIKFPAEPGKAYFLCLGDGTQVSKCRTTSKEVQKTGSIPDNLKARLRTAILSRKNETGQTEKSPYDTGSGIKKNQAVRRQEIRFSVAVPLYNTDHEHLADMLESVFHQTYENWELCLADGSPVSILESCRGQEDRLSRVIEEFLTDPRVKYVHLAENRGISGNSNEAFRLAEGDFVVMLDHDDLLEADALSQTAAVLCARPDTDFVYSDSDLTDHDGLYCYNPLYKPDWSPETLICANYITHLSVVRRELLMQLGGLKPEYDGAQDWDLFLRIGEATDRICHIPKVLYHWRAAETSTALDVSLKPYAREAQLRAVSDYLTRRGVPGRAVFVDRGSTCIRVEWQDNLPEADVVIRRQPGVELEPEDAQELRRFASLPGMGVIGVRVVNGKGRILSQGLLLERDGLRPLFAGSFPGTAGLLGHTDWYRDGVASEPVCYAVSRRVWDQIGPVDESLGDLAVIDLCLRARAAGLRNMVTPFVQVQEKESVAQRIAASGQGAYRKLLAKYQTGEPG